MQQVAQKGIVGRLLQRGAKVASLLSTGKGRLFTYDDLMDAKALEAIKIYPTRSVVAFVDGYELAPVVASNEQGVGYLSLVKEPRAKVYGVLHDVSAIEILLLEALITLRGGQYQRTMVNVVDELGLEERAWTFVARRPLPHLRCRRSFVAKMVVLADRFAFPSAYLAMLEKQPTIDAPCTIPSLHGDQARHASDARFRDARLPHMVGMQATTPSAAYFPDAFSR